MISTTNPTRRASCRSHRPALLFNIADDPFEQHDLAAQQPQRAAAMEAALERWFVDVTGI